MPSHVTGTVTKARAEIEFGSTGDDAGKGVEDVSSIAGGYGNRNTGMSKRT